MQNVRAARIQIQSHFWTIPVWRIRVKIRLMDKGYGQFCPVALASETLAQRWMPLILRELCAGATLYLPVPNRGALFSAGDAHAAQGDGEVCINGMECPVDVTLRFHLHKQRPLSAPMIETSAQQTRDADGGEWIIVESATDSTVAARAATSRMIDFLAEHWGFSEVHAYVLCSVAMNLRISQVVNEPIFTVSAAISKTNLPQRRIF